MHSLHGLHGLQSAWSAFWGDRVSKAKISKGIQSKTKLFFQKNNNWGKREGGGGWGVKPERLSRGGTWIVKSSRVWGTR